ncbi:hypothetical protein PS943_02083 [Pseudomonas fluorescens]|uniref:Uncharacterized protein n=1 Tax=Pseudomonas fluorescens TaxID=294 RepID=A0A5E7W7M9_PSEFL|nr:hypothetical protein PS943_02083 [Pseudomonas fluorescens]
MSELSKARIPDAPAIQRLPLLQLILVGLQHVLLMYGGAIAVPLIIGQAADLLFNILGGAERAAINDCHAPPH